MKLWRRYREQKIEAAVDRGDYRQAIAYALQCTRQYVPEDVDIIDLQAAFTPGIGGRRWEGLYAARRACPTNRRIDMPQDRVGDRVGVD